MKEETPQTGREETQNPGVGTSHRQERGSFLLTRRREKTEADAGMFVVSVTGSQRNPSQMHSIFCREKQVRVLAKREEV